MLRPFIFPIALHWGVQASLPSLRPLRGVCYGALPCNGHGCGGEGIPSEDMLQDVYEGQWGPDGRDDLNVMARLGANGVRLYHSLGMLPGDRPHGGFLDRAEAVGLNVLPGYHTYMALGCPDWDCFQAWKDATLDGFRLGFKKNNEWHPAVAMLTLLNEPDFFWCQPAGARCRVKAMLSALDGVLAAEREANISSGRVKLTVTWSFGVYTSIDGKVTGPAVFGFQDVVAGIKDPSLAGYEPRSTQAQMQDAFDKRWVHGFNTQAPWNFVKEVIGNSYDQFKPTPWFIGEYGANYQTADVIRSDLEGMQREAADPVSPFLGAAFFQFQTAYWKGGSERNFGLFALGSQKVGETGDLCNIYGRDCHNRPVYCLSTDLYWLSGTAADRAEAVAAAWGGSLDGLHGVCIGAHRRLSLIV